MPLEQGDTLDVINKNVHKLIKEGYSAQQAVAIAHQEAKKYKKKKK